MLDETIKHIKGLQLHLQMMKEHGLGFLSQCMEMGKIQKMQSSQYYSTCIPMRSPSGVGYGHGTLPYQPISPEDEGGGGVWPQISGNGVLPYYYDYPPEPILFPDAADGSPLPPVVTAEVWAHVSPTNNQPVVPAAQVLARVSPSKHHPLPPMLPILRQLSLPNQCDPINYHEPIMPNVQQIPRTVQEFSLLIKVPEKLGEASTSYGRNPVDHSYKYLDGFGQTHPRK